MFEVCGQTGATYSSLMGAGVESPRRSKSVMIVSHHFLGDRVESISAALRPPRDRRTVGLFATSPT
jgi:hypothetical protein